MKDEMPHRFEAKGDDDDHDDDEDDDDDDDADVGKGAGKKQVNGAKPNGNGAAAAGKKSNGGPRILSPGGANRGPGKVYRISKERKEAMVEAGIWDDAKARTRMIKRYAAYDRENNVK
jgi:hypothetical protein